MVRLIIVDDEKTTRDSLKEYIPWNELGVDFVATAKNGLAALELVQEIKPDILLTDIRMPKMDGIDLAFNIRKLYKDCTIIFLSAYSDKEYLKKAIHIQAVSYIEKPICVEELKSVIRQAVKDQLKKAAENAKEIRLRNSLDKSLPLIRQEITVELVRGVTSLTELCKKYGETIVNFPNTEYFTPACLLINWHPELEDWIKISLKKIILGVLSGANTTNFVHYLTGFEDDEKIIFIFPGKFQHVQTINVLEDLMKKLRKFSGGRFSLTAGVGPPAHGITNLPNSYRFAVTAANTQFYSGPGKVYVYRSVTDSCFKPEKNLFKLFRTYLSRNERKEAAKLVQALTTEFKTYQTRNINYVKNIYFNLLLIIFEVARDRGFIDPCDENEKNYIWQEIEKIKTLEEISAHILSNIESVFSKMEEENAVHYKVYEIMRYIEENYAAKNLSVRSIAEHTYLSHTYLCAFFKKNTGKTINEYITKVRIEKAKEFLREGKMKLYEVADKIGYTDPNYFSSLFKKHTGLTPSEFREKIIPC